MGARRTTTASRFPTFCPLALAVMLVACAAQPRRPQFSGAVGQLQGVSCPEDRIRVEAWREVDDEFVYTLDACGKKVEVVQGIALPARKSEVIEISAENPAEGALRSGAAVPQEKVALVRRRVQAWCYPKGTRVGEDAIAFITDNPAECRKKLAETLVPIRTERDENTGELSHWFRMGQYLFAARETLSSKGSQKTAVAASFAPRASDNPRAGSGPGGQRTGARWWTGRIQLGPGYLATARSDGFGYTAYGELGPKLGHDMALVFVSAIHAGIHSATPQENPRLWQLGAAFAFYPIPEDGLRIDAGLGAGPLRYGWDGDSEGGGIVAAGIGYDGGNRKRPSSHWTGFAVSIRGTYLFASNDEVMSLTLNLGAYAF